MTFPRHLTSYMMQKHGMSYCNAHRFLRVIYGVANVGKQ